MLKFANWWLFAVFAISSVVCGKKWRISKEIVKNTKTDLQNMRIILFKTVFIFSITAFWNFAKKLGRYCTLMQLVLLYGGSKMILLCSGKDSIYSSNSTGSDIIMTSNCNYYINVFFIRPAENTNDNMWKLISFMAFSVLHLEETRL